MEQGQGNWGRLALMSGATSAVLIYQIASATEAPGTALKFLQYGLLALSLIALAGALVKLASGRSES
jgi:hypothetical protein